MNPRPLKILTVYSAALMQGFTLVSFPASSAVLRATHGLSDAQYGLIFLPQVAAAVAGAVAGGALAQSIGLKSLLRLALLVNAVSQLALAAVARLPDSWTIPSLISGTACLGLGFGLLGAPINSFPPQLFPRHRETAVVVVHSLVGGGLMLGPLWLDLLQGAWGWAAFPASLGILCAALAVLSGPLDFGNSSVSEPTRQAATAPAVAPPMASATFWLFAAIAVLYAFAEGTYSNWAVVYLQEGKHLPAMTAALALSVFWGTLVGGRLLISVLVLRLPASAIWLCLPALMAGGFLLLPYANTPLRAIAAFALCGAACSAFFPLSVALVSARFPLHVASVSSMLVAALMVGVGLGSFVIGTLRSLLTFEQLYRWSALYPLSALTLAILVSARGALRSRPVA